MTIRSLLLVTLLILLSSWASLAQAQARQFYQHRALGQQAVSAVHQSEPDLFWLATYDGVVRLDLAGDSLFTARPDDGQSGHSFTDVVQDRDGQLWVTERSNVIRFDGQRWFLIPLDQPVAVLVGLDLDSEGNVWVAGGLGRLSPVVARLSGSTVTLYEAADGLAADFISALLVDGQDQVWTATEQGLNYFDGDTWHIVETDRAGQRISHITDLAESATGELWGVTSFGDVLRIDPASRTVEVMSEVAPFEGVEHVASGGDVVWVASGRQVAVYTEGRWEVVSSIEVEEGGEILDLEVGSDGALLVGTTHGLVVEQRE